MDWIITDGYLSLTTTNEPTLSGTWMSQHRRDLDEGKDVSRVWEHQETRVETYQMHLVAIAGDKALLDLRHHDLRFPTKLPRYENPHDAEQL